MRIFLLRFVEIHNLMDLSIAFEQHIAEMLRIGACVLIAILLAVIFVFYIQKFLARMREVFSCIVFNVREYLSCIELEVNLRFTLYRGNSGDHGHKKSKWFKRHKKDKK